MNAQRKAAFKARAHALVAQMDLLEKANLLRYDSPGVPRLGIPAYNWWNEGLHGVARTGTATVFPQAIGLAAMWDEHLLKTIGRAVAVETRVKFNENQKQGVVGRYKGLTLWSPNINLFRDPRWGRGQETYGEDPVLTARLGVAYIQGLQGDGDYWQTAACAKHFAAHSGPEQGRHAFNAAVSPKDLFESYLPAFEAAVRQGDVAGVMGAYNRLNGEVCCGNRWLLQDLLRRQWGFSGYVVSDCGAIADFHNHHKVTRTPAESAAKAVAAGCDINCGDVYVQLVRAVEQGLVDEAALTAAAERALAVRLALGLLADEPPFADLDYDLLDCPAHRELALEAARRSAVLLKNNGLLPLDVNKLTSLAVIGPNARNVEALHGNYNGVASQYVTLLDGIMNACGDRVRVRYARGCHSYLTPETDPGEAEQQSQAEAVAAAAHSDAVILCLGLDPTFEGEEGDASNPYGAGDRKTLALPEPQQRLVRAVAALGKPTVVVLCAGGAVDLRYEDAHFDAILDVFYPGGRGGQAVADLLFGNASPCGCLPVTFYQSDAQLPPFEDYAMAGRTYRYFTGEPLYPFGFGLAYGRAELTAAACTPLADGTARVTATVRNPSRWPLRTLVQVYGKPDHSPLAPPNPSLWAFERAELAPGQETTLTLTLPAAAFTVVDHTGARVTDDDSFTVYVGLCGPDPRSAALTGHTPVVCRVARPR